MEIYGAKLRNKHNTHSFFYHYLQELQLYGLTDMRRAGSREGGEGCPIESRKGIKRPLDSSKSELMPDRVIFTRQKAEDWAKRLQWVRKKPKGVKG